VLKRRNYPLAFKEDATNEDIVGVMQGKLGHTVFLEGGGREHQHPVVVYKEKTIFVKKENELETCLEVPAAEVRSERRGKSDSTPGKSLITRWVKTDSGAV